jgi:hypothetical protein
MWPLFKHSTLRDVSLSFRRQSFVSVCARGAQITRRAGADCQPACLAVAQVSANLMAEKQAGDMSISQPTSPAPKYVEFPAQDASRVDNVLEELYAGAIDVAVIRGALVDERLPALAGAVDRGDRQLQWKQPNAAVAIEDIQVLGTAATPTYSTPRGPTLNDYLEDASWYDRSPVFGTGFDPKKAITHALARHSGGRPVDILQSPDGRPFAPFTVRRLAEGKGIGLHHDLHTSLSMFRDIAPSLDTSTLISWVVTLQGPESGGELLVYAATPDTPDPPKLANGFSWDLAGVEARYGSVKVATEAGDLFLFASARCLHRVSPVVGSRARFTMGGFLAFSATRDRVIFWS